MKSILNNPYRITGLLVGATAREQDRQVRRLKQYIEAEQVPEEDFSFPILGKLPRTIADVENAVSELNLDSDKMSAALFWFYKGNTITDEPAFEALKDGDFDTAYKIWDKLITETKEDGKRFWKSVTEKNCSAFHNCSILNIVMPNGHLYDAIAGGIYFLESDLVHNFVSIVVDSTYKPSKKDLQLSFLNQLLSDIVGDSKRVTLVKFTEILEDLQFSAKEDFLKSLEGIKDRELSEAIEVLKTIKSTYETNIGVSPRGYDKPIDQFLFDVNQISEETLYWDKVVDLILKAIPQKNIEKIKSTNNPVQIDEYKSLADFVISKFSFSQVNKVKYICYWKTDIAVSNVEFTTMPLERGNFFLRKVVLILIIILIIVLVVLIWNYLNVFGFYWLDKFN